ncbi:MAG: DNA primase [Streptococcaceae bacterium]|jgi:DNA primase|nr:DNA primase [Streptococcaceae bacterium]
MVNKISFQVIEKVRKQTDIVSIIGQYVQLRKTGKNYSALCPFHSEKTPSFTVVKDKQMYYCFGCGKGGDIFKFFQDLESISFLEAVKKVAKIEQISFAGLENINKQQNPEIISLFKMQKKAAKLYHHLLINTKVGTKALVYLRNRGIVEEMFEIFQIGFAPDMRTLLVEAFEKDGFSEDDYQKSGLFIIREDGSKLDRFYNRIIFPICNDSGQVIALSGRILEKDEKDVKYLNSPETKLFKKSENLYNFHLAQNYIRKTKEVFLFEGFMDVIAAFSAGIRSGVASMGTNFTKKQLKKILPCAKSVVIAYDGDDPGEKSTQKAINEIKMQTKLDIKVLMLPEMLDPDEYVRKYGEKAFYEFAKHGRSSVFEFMKRYFKKDKNLANETEKITYVNELLEELSQVTSQIEQDLYLNKIVQEFPEITLESLHRQLDLIKLEKQKQISPFKKKQELKQVIKAKPVKKKLSAGEKAEKILLFRIMTNSWFYKQINKFSDFHFHTPALKRVYESYQAFYKLHKEFIEADFLTSLEDEDEKNTFSEIMISMPNNEASKEELQELLKTIQREKLKVRIDEKKLEQQAAKRIGNISQELNLAIEIVELKKNYDLMK